MLDMVFFLVFFHEQSLFWELRKVCRDFRDKLPFPSIPSSLTVSFMNVSILRAKIRALQMAGFQDRCRIRHATLQSLASGRQQKREEAFAYARSLCDFLKLVQEGGLDTLVLKNIRVLSKGDLKYYTFSNVKHVVWAQSKIDAATQDFIRNYLLTDNGHIEFE